MKQFATLRRGLLGAAALLGMVAGSAQAADPGVTPTEITIGMFAPMSGTLAAFGVDPLQAAKAWFEDINKKGGIHGRKIKVIVEDDKCNANEVVAIVKKLITVDKVFMINGGSCTAATVAAQEFITREKVPHVMINAAGDGAVFPPTRYVFGAFGGTQRSVGATIMEFAIAHFKAKKVAFIAHDDDFGNSNSTTAAAVAKRLGVNVAVLERISPRVTDVTAPMLKVREAKPDVIISTMYPAPAVLLTQKYGEYKLSNIPLIVAVQGIPIPAVFAKNVGDDSALKNLYYSSPLNDLTDGPKQQKWLQLYKQYYPDRTPGAFMAYGLPGAMAIAMALEKAGKDLTREKFIDAMETLNFDSGVLAGPTTFGKDRRDGYRSSVFIKFDGKTHTLIPGVYTWNGKDGM
ncbi:MAG: ABC transporter substrate-binding protein [Alphaproteobacteria bacterium]